MAVLKSKRKQSRLEVIHNYYKLRDAMTFKLFNNFGYREYHAERRISHKYFNNVPRHELSLPEQQIFAERLELSNKIFEEYIVAERKHLLQALRELGGYIVGANGIWPTIEEEAIERRLLQDRALVNLEHQKIDKSLLTGEKMMRKHVNLGDEISQIAGLCYPMDIDNYIKIVRGCKYYARYMDDSYLIAKDKNCLISLRNEIENKAHELGLTLNPKKTRIVKLSSSWRFMQVQYSLTDTGRIIQKIRPERLMKMRRKLKKLAGRLPECDFDNLYRSWFKGHYKLMSKKQRQNLDELHKKLKEEKYGLHD